MEKNLKNKAISIHGKDYVMVSDRVLFFNETYLNGSISTEIIPDNELWIIRATITPDHGNPDRKFTAYSQALEGSTNINKTSALENAETSAVGRALGFMGIGVIDSIASNDEIVKAKNTEKVLTQNAPSVGEKHKCSKCGAINTNAKIFAGKYGECFKCDVCSGYSKPHFVLDNPSKAMEVGELQF